MIEFIGRLHPALVHLPIGIFLLSIILEFASIHGKRQSWSTSILPINFIGIIFSVLSILSGLLLANEGNNSVEDVDLHKWTAIATTLFFTVYTISRNTFISNKAIHVACLLTLSIGLISTGHLGGTLTHGENFLSINNKDNQQELALNITDINKAGVYSDVIQFTLNKKCVQCHGVEKQKGQLRLDDSTWVLSGGKNGKVISKEQLEKSELLKRILLETNDEKHMPPKGKEQLTDFEKAIFNWWISSGASFNKQVVDLQPDEKTWNQLNKFKEYYSKKNTTKKREEVSPISIENKLLLEKSGWVVYAISNTDNHIRAIGYNLEQPLKASIEKLLLIKEQLVELKLSASGIQDEDLVSISQLTHVEKLWLDDNQITDKGLTNLTSLQKLNYLNLASTGISTDGLQKLKQLPSLKQIYLYGTNISLERITMLQDEWMGVNLYRKDTMYTVPTDTLFTKPQ